jgi:hypothetical protein
MEVQKPSSVIDILGSLSTPHWIAMHLCQMPVSQSHKLQLIKCIYWNLEGMGSPTPIFGGKRHFRRKTTFPTDDYIFDRRQHFFVCRFRTSFRPTFIISTTSRYAQIRAGEFGVGGRRRRRRSTTCSIRFWCHCILPHCMLYMIHSNFWTWHSSYPWSGDARAPDQNWKSNISMITSLVFLYVDDVSPLKLFYLRKYVIKLGKMLSDFNI